MISSVISKAILKEDMTPMYHHFQFPELFLLLSVYRFHLRYSLGLVFSGCSQGVTRVYGKVGLCSPPHLVLPLTLAPSKPRLCQGERFLGIFLSN